MPRFILVVENDPPLLQTLADTVMGLGYDATVATTGVDSVTLAEVAPPDAIILDIAVPEATGMTTFERLRQAHPGVPIIMVAPASSEQFVRDSLKRGAFDYVTKPLNVSHLTEVLRAAVRRTAR
ncbi:MAG TPA: response regulator [Methylomirabilota bacterium]|jgi:DNA-binding response OmpR family regulator